MTGASELVSEQAIELLYKAYFKITDVAKSIPPAPLASWFTSPDEPENFWKPEFAIPLSHPVAELPYEQTDEFEKTESGNWEYGSTAVILQKGGYNTEEPTVKKLTDFI